MTKRGILAKIIARVLDPIIEIPLILFTVSSYAYLNGYRYRFLFLLIFLDAILPGLMFLYHLYKKGLRSFELHNRMDRLPLFLLTVLTHGISVMIAYLIERHPLAEILLAYWFLTVIFTLITLKWRISVHSGVNAALAVTAIYLGGNQYLWTLILPILVSWARVEDKDHTPMQVIVSSVLTIAVLWLSLRGLSVFRL